MEVVFKKDDKDYVHLIDSCKTVREILDFVAKNTKGLSNQDLIESFQIIDEKQRKIPAKRWTKMRGLDYQKITIEKSVPQKVRIFCKKIIDFGGGKTK